MAGPEIHVATGATIAAEVRTLTVTVRSAFFNHRDSLLQVKPDQRDLGADEHGREIDKHGKAIEGATIFISEAPIVLKNALHGDEPAPTGWEAAGIATAPGPVTFKRVGEKTKKEHKRSGVVTEVKFATAVTGDGILIYNKPDLLQHGATAGVTKIPLPKAGTWVLKIMPPADALQDPPAGPGVDIAKSDMRDRKYRPLHVIIEVSDKGTLTHATTCELRDKSGKVIDNLPGADGNVVEDHAVARQIDDWDGQKVTLTRRMVNYGYVTKVGPTELAIDMKPDAVRAPDRPKVAKSRKTMIGIHCTGGNATGVLIDTATDKAGAFQPHYEIDWDGHVVKFCNDLETAYHVAPGEFWSDAESRDHILGDINGRSIGIEMIHYQEDPEYTDAQMVALIDLVVALKKLYDVEPHRIFGHSDVQGTEQLGSKFFDPGRGMRWSLLEAKGCGREARAAVLGKKDDASDYYGFFAMTPAERFKAFGVRDSVLTANKNKGNAKLEKVFKAIQEDLRTCGYCVGKGTARSMDFSHADGKFEDDDIPRSRWESKHPGKSWANAKKNNGYKGGMHMAVKRFVVRTFSGRRKSLYGGPGGHDDRVAAEVTPVVASWIKGSAARIRGEARPEFAQKPAAPAVAAEAHGECRVGSADDDISDE
jgi:N-acetyl-anhydromuramyl-L-alanine amidase AmpD